MPSPLPRPSTHTDLIAHLANDHHIGHARTFSPLGAALAHATAHQSPEVAHVHIEHRRYEPCAGT